ncbi:MAG: UDP-N-acetylmuramate dehydrogenase [Oscillospiraceae bacterium]|jgi:UDP-N-acetylmuramate dehydrogenase|nr:UDP-N-acetylmuramate dehydrogenase [Oscillospiraceae bacterium]
MNNYNKLEEICKNYGAEFKMNAPLAPHTTFKIGGPCDALVKVANYDMLKKALLFCKENRLPYRIFGNGSNILVRDEGVRGVVLLLGKDFALTAADEKSGFVVCGAGVSLTALCLAARDASLTGLEFAYGIPGTVGGAIYMNAGAYDGEIANRLHSCDYLDGNGNYAELDCLKERENFSYRKSPFTGSGKIIVSAEFQLSKGDKAQITAKMDDFMNRRREKQPLEFPSAGSTFKRPEGGYASRLIDVCGLKGFSVGGAQVSEKHAGFIINKGGATCSDVLKLIEAVKERVFKETGIMLEREVEVLG